MKCRLAQINTDCVDLHDDLPILKIIRPLDDGERRTIPLVGIADRFPRAVERLENLFLVFRLSIGTSFPRRLA